jgi:nicotinamide-nucleotide amidase
MQIQLLMTGSELMRGTTTDTNSVRIADALATLGLAIQRKVTIGDDLALLVRELQAMSREADVLIVNGGLGPTSDDLTAEALAQAAGDTLVENAAALAHLEQWCAARQIALNAANRKQALLPSRAFLVPNPVGSAVGFGLKLNDCLVLCTPGVPRELEGMLADSIVPQLARDYAGCEQQMILRLHLFGIGESQAQDMIDRAIPAWPDGVVLGFRAGMPTVEVKLLVRKSAAAAAQPLFAQLKTLLADYIVAEGEQNLQAALLDLLAAQGKTLACAESCTGGLISSMLTEIPGSSRAFTAGFVTYSNAMKTALLGVHGATLDDYGAVSEQTVREMAGGALARSGADIAVAVSGVAGPDGGSAEKPVGTVWIAWGTQGNIQARCFRLGSPRKRCQQLTAAIALDLVRRTALGQTQEPPYFARWAM